MLMANTLSGPLNRVVWVAGILGTVLLLLTLSFTGDHVPVVVLPLIAATTALIGVVVGVLFVPAASRRAFEAFAWLGRREMNRFRERTGSKVPTNPAAVQRWLADNPRSSATAWARLELLAILGRTDEAAAEQALLPPPKSDADAVEQALARRFTTFIATGTLDEREMDELAARLPPDSDTARELAVARAIGVARLRIAAGRDDWRDPLLAVRPQLGFAPTRIVTRDLWLRIWWTTFVVGLLICVIEVVLLS
jgi:hypothetical protein